MGRQQKHCATALDILQLTVHGGLLCTKAAPLTGHYNQINTALPGPDIVPQHGARMLSNFYLRLFRSPSPGQWRVQTTHTVGFWVCFFLIF